MAMRSVRDPERPVQLGVRLGFVLGVASILFGGFDILGFATGRSTSNLWTGLLGFGILSTGVACVVLSILLGKHQAKAVKPLLWLCASNALMALIALILELLIVKQPRRLAFLVVWLLADIFVLFVLKQASVDVEQGVFNTIPGQERIVPKKRTGQDPSSR